MTFAVVPACGHSTRMGRPKLALPAGKRTVIERVVAALREGGADLVLVVVGPHVPELAPFARQAGAEVLHLAEPTADMGATVEAGLAWLEARHQPTPDDRWLLCPGDFPTLSSAVVRTLLDAAVADDGEGVYVPVHGGRRGHPLLAGWRHVAGVRALPAGVGINAYLAGHRDRVREVAVPDAGGHFDLDTPADYARLLGSS